jgi:hypothetical protein
MVTAHTRDRLKLWLTALVVFFGGLALLAGGAMLIGYRGNADGVRLIMRGAFVAALVVSAWGVYRTRRWHRP